MIANVMPIIIEDTRFTPGIIVAKLLPAMKAQKQADGMDVTANTRNIAVASTPPIVPMAAS